MIAPGTHPDDQPVPYALTPQAEAALDADGPAWTERRLPRYKPMARDYGVTDEPEAEAGS